MMSRKAIDSKTAILLTIVLAFSTVTFTIVPPTSTSASASNSPLETNQHQWWPKLQYNLSNIGYNPYSTAPSTNQTAWIHGGDVGEGGPTVADGVVFTASGWNVVALNMTTGAELWSFSADGTVRSAPAVDVDNGLVFVGSDGPYLYCLNKTDGSEKWRYSPGSGRTLSRNSPAIHDGKVFFGCAGQAGQAHNVTCLTIEGQLVWYYPIPDQIRGCPAIVDGRLYIGAADDTMYCLNETTGTLIWSYLTSPAGDIRGSPAVVDGKVFFGNQNGTVFCLDAYTGTKLWSYSTGSPVFTSPAVAYGLIFIASNNDTFYCLNETTGALVWSYVLGTGPTPSAGKFASPAVADGKVYIGSNDGKVLCLNATSTPLTTEERLIWSYQAAGTGLRVAGPPAIADGFVFVGSFDDAGQLFAFGPDLAPPTVANVVQSPAATEVDPGEDVTVTAIGVTDNVAIDKVLLRYSTNNETFTDVLMTRVGGTNNFTGQIPGQAADTYVTYKIFVNDTSGYSYETPPEQYYSYRVVPEFPTWASTLVIFIVLTFTIAIYKRRLVKKPIH
jgi:outer membrane protein assembly factor BamB